jgi:DNA-binding beta-propeller fold protein YncE
MPEFCQYPRWGKDGNSRLPFLQFLTSFHPRSIFVDNNGNIYVSFDKHGIVSVWLDKSETFPSKVYYGNNSNTNLQDILTWGRIWNILRSWLEAPEVFLSIPNSLFVASSDDIYVGNGGNNQINIWTLVSGKSPIILDSDGPCYGLFIDIEYKLYCSVKDANKVIKKSLNGDNKEWTEVVGNTNGVSESLPKKLNNPYGIFVDKNFDLYVADFGGNRIQIFKGGQSEENMTISVNMQIEGLFLDGPTNVILDADKNLYIVDSQNHRIVFVESNFEQGRCLIGCSGKTESRSDQLSYPIGISFDRSGNLFISDSKNNRVLKFILETRLCSKFNEYLLKSNHFYDPVSIMAVFVIT